MIGLGAMGRPLASRLIDAGYAVHAYDVSGDAVERLVADGARAAGSAAAVAENAPFVLTVLPEAADVRRALLGASGAVEGAASGSIFFDASTIDPMSIQEIGGELGGTGITVLDGGVAGNPAMARDGIATLMVGGPQEAVEESRPILEALCGTLIYTGELGTAKTVKLVNNMVGAVSMAAVAEAFDLALKAGVEPEIIYDSMMGSWGRCFQLEIRPPMPGLAEGSPADDDYEPDFSVDYMIKDLSYALRTAEEQGSYIGLSALTRELYAASSARGEGSKDISVIGRAIEAMGDGPGDGSSS